MVCPTLDIEKELWSQGYNLICGIDEVGRGCFAGPVVAGAVVFPKDIVLPEGIADSKLLTPKKREILSKIIKEVALFWAVGEISVESINEVGIGVSTNLAFLEAIKNLGKTPDYYLIDAFFIKDLDKKNQKPIPSGDKICASISAASIIAKVYRDDLMRKLSQVYPQYGFEQNNGYGTKDHRDALKKHGLCEFHRTSFNLDKFL
ncbi:MAG: ribonuclease HII [Candidatus Daviesbacteria bacterium]|nr:ribonuclease HII [Candidatus Daviesbacteria bacterium]